MVLQGMPGRSPGYGVGPFLQTWRALYPTPNRRRGHRKAGRVPTARKGGGPRSSCPWRRGRGKWAGGCLRCEWGPGHSPVCQARRPLASLPASAPRGPRVPPGGAHRWVIGPKGGGRVIRRCAEKRNRGPGIGGTGIRGFGRRRESRGASGHPIRKSHRGHPLPGTPV